MIELHAEHLSARWYKYNVPVRCSSCGAFHEVVWNMQRGGCLCKVCIDEMMKEL